MRSHSDPRFGNRRFSRNKPTNGVSIGCFTCAVAIVLFIGALVWLIMGIGDWMAGDRNQVLVGDPSRYDPFANLDELRAIAGPDARLVSINAFQVRSDGTMNLNADYVPRPTVTYRFVLPLAKPPENAPPSGVTGPAGAPWMQFVTLVASRPGGFRRVIERRGISRNEYMYRHRGLDKDVSTPVQGQIPENLPDPKISTAELWRMGREKGAPDDAVANIDYDQAGYRWSVVGFSEPVMLDLDGKPR